MKLKKLNIILYVIFFSSNSFAALDTYSCIETSRVTEGNLPKETINRVILYVCNDSDSCKSARVSVPNLTSAEQSFDKKTVHIYVNDYQIVNSNNWSGSPALLLNQTTFDQDASSPVRSDNASSVVPFSNGKASSGEISISGRSTKIDCEIVNL